MLFEQVLFNLLDNAAKYAPAGLDRHACAAGGTAARCVLQLLDEGDGHPADEDSSASSTSSTACGRATGSGPAPASGSSICRGFVEAMGGTIAAGNRPTARAPSSRSRLPVPAGSRHGWRRRHDARPGRILVVDDEPPIRRFLRTASARTATDVAEAATGREALGRLAGAAPDLVILDLGLPDIQGQDVIRTPPRARLGGADRRPVEPQRRGRQGRGARPRAPTTTSPSRSAWTSSWPASARRSATASQQQGERPVFRSGDLAVDLVRRTVRVRDAEVKLSPKEYDILRALVAHAGQVLTHQFLLKEVWGGETDPQYLRIYVRSLRQKIEADPSRPRHILTESGVGYRLCAPD